LDGLVSTAALLGRQGSAPWAIGAQEFDAVLAANLRGPFLCAREAMRWMVERGAPGRIVNVSSGAGRMAAAGLAPYVASKHGLEGLTHALALDAEGTGIAVCALALGPLQTEMTRTTLPWEEHVALPPPESVVPLFAHALTAPAAEIHDRVLAAWRHAQDPQAEARLARPLAAFRKAGFEPFEHRGRRLARGVPDLQFLD